MQVWGWDEDLLYSPDGHLAQKRISNSGGRPSIAHTHLAGHKHAKENFGRDEFAMALQVSRSLTLLRFLGARCPCLVALLLCPFLDVLLLRGTGCQSAGHHLSGLCTPSSHVGTPRSAPKLFHASFHRFSWAGHSFQDPLTRIEHQHPPGLARDSEYPRSLCYRGYI